MLTYIKLVYSSKRCQPHQTLSSNSVDEQVFTREHRLAQTLRLSVLRDLAGTGQESIFADRPLLSAIHGKRDDVAKQIRGERDFTRPRIRRLGHLTSSEELLHGELDLACKLDCASHVHHSTGFGAHRATLLEVDVQDGIGVAVGDAVAATLEGADVCLSWWMAGLALRLARSWWLLVAWLSVSW